jgi:hypothetical protein
MRRFFPRSYDTLDNKWSEKLDVVTSLMTSLRVHSPLSADRFFLPDDPHDM